MTEVEAVLNSRPLTYMYSEDIETPLTPSHLVMGKHLLTLPDTTVKESNEVDLRSDLTRRAYRNSLFTFGIDSEESTFLVYERTTKVY